MGILSSIGSTLLSAAPGIAEGIFNNATAISQSQRDYRYAKQLMEYQNDWNLNQWNRENQYNSPKAIMSRYADAGLNPNLIYQNNGISASHLESAGGNAQTKSVAPARFDMLAAYNVDAQNQLLKEQKALTHENMVNAAVNGNILTRKASQEWYNEQYAKAEYDRFLKTGKIPESYNKTQWTSELTGLAKGFLQKYFGI